MSENGTSPWQLYDRLIDGIPQGIGVKDYCLGMRWSYLEAECGMGVCYTGKGGAKRQHRGDLREMELREVAALSKSWCFEEASLGVAALNAYYARREQLDPLHAIYDEPVNMPDGSLRKTDAFELYRERIETNASRNVVVVGHFPHVERIMEYANLTVLERNCTSALDTPDPACEYVLPESDFAFVTGVTFINKTAPRILELAQKPFTVMVGPSVVMNPIVFEYGADVLAGSIVEDPEKTRFAVKNAAGMLFGEAIRMTSISKSR